MRAEEKGLVLRLDIDPQVPALLCGDPGRLRQILINLLGNAIKFTAKGSVRLCLQQVSSDAQGCELHGQVIDTGIGIAPHAQAGIFDAFSQADSSISRKFGGTGLGLSIVARMLELMHGRLWLESELGHGSTFHFSLRLSHSHATTPQPQTTLEPSVTLPSLQVLLVEDNEINAILARKLLERQQHQVTWARNGQEALDLLRQQRFDLAFMDMYMPEMGGLQATEQIRQHEARSHAHLPIIAMTANALASDRDACLAAGMDGYVSKPINRQQLQEEMQRILANHLPAASSPMATHPAPPLSDVDYLGAFKQVDPFIVQVIGAPFVAACRSEYLEKMQRALLHGDSQTLQLTAHSLKALLGSFELSRAQVLAEQLELHSQHGELAQAAVVLEQLAAQVDCFLPLLAAHLTAQPRA